MKLIDKDAVVIKIDEKIKEITPYLGACGSQIAAEASNKIAAFVFVKDMLNNFEVKEVDLEKELNDYGYHYDYVSLADRKELVDFAKHFFELGLKARGV